METNQYMEMFLDESREHLQSLNDGLLSLENDPEDLSVLNEIFRNAHTLKGMSATMGYTKTAELTHDMENLLDMLRKEQLKVSSEIIDVIFKCVDSLQEMVENIGNGESEDLVDVSDLVRMVNAIAKGESVQQEGPEADGGAAAAPAAASGMPEGCELNDTDMLVIKEAKNSGLIPYWVHVEIADTCLLKSARSYMVMNVLDELGDVIKSIPPAQDLEQEKFDHSFDVCLVTDAEAKKVEDGVTVISEISGVKVTEINLEEAPKEAPAPAAAAKAAAPAAAPKAAAPAAKPAAKAPANNAKHDKKAHVAGQSVRVDIEKLDTLMNLVGELVTNKVRLEQIGMTHRLTE
ncbi:MAG: Hpt domain-containing protein, partial [Selenomonadaceae bacterium]|nr:Hpt domain-containing protein [Selenomonadaceae bacterium]